MLDPWLPIRTDGHLRFSAVRTDGERIDARASPDQSSPGGLFDRLRTVSTSPGDEHADPSKEHHRTPAEEIEWIGAEVEARPRVMFWGTIAVAVILASALIIVIVVVTTGSSTGN